MQKNKTKYSSGLLPITIRELKKRCILRGIPFENVSDGVPELNEWLYKLRGNDEDPLRLIEYDSWITDIIRSGKYAEDIESLLHPTLMFSTPPKDEEAERDENGERVVTKLPKIKKAKAKAGLFGFREGTKKHLVAELMIKGCSLKLIQKRIIHQFGDVNSSSLKIWAKIINKLIDEKK